jgi:hypothetical protein
MKFLCLDCDEPMKLHSSEGPQEGSLTVTFRCPECGFRVAMLTNPFETQMVKSLGVKIGPAATAAGEAGGSAGPLEHVRASLAHARSDAFEGAAAGPGEGGSTCPFASMLGEGAVATPAGLAWTAEAEARIARIPEFIRPMARRAVERYAEGKGYRAITDAVMEEARGAFGM